jgi:hypothetical protein
LICTAVTIQTKIPTSLRFNTNRHKADKATSSSIWIGVGIGGGIGLILLIVIVILWRSKAAKMETLPMK